VTVPAPRRQSHRLRVPFSAWLEPTAPKDVFSPFGILVRGCAPPRGQAAGDLDGVRRAVAEKLALLAEVEENQRALRALAGGGLARLAQSGLWPRPPITFREEAD